jgi:hypothetical protein
MTFSSALLYLALSLLFDISVQNDLALCLERALPAQHPTPASAPKAALLLPVSHSRGAHLGLDMVGSRGPHWPPPRAARQRLLGADRAQARSARAREALPFRDAGKGEKDRRRQSRHEASHWSVEWRKEGEGAEGRRRVWFKRREITPSD